MKGKLTTPTDTEVQTFIIEGQRYAAVPIELLEHHAPELLARTRQPRKPSGDAVPWEVLKRSISEEVSMAKAWREYLNLPQEEVAKRMGVSQASLSQTEAAKRPRKATLEKVAKALGVTLEQLRG